MKKDRKEQKTGFTLVELTLAIAFLGVLVLMSSAVIVQVVSVYNKGVALKQINQAGRSLIEDINRISTAGYDVRLAADGTAGYLCVRDSNLWRSYNWDSVRKGAGASATPGGLPEQPFLLDGQLVSLARSNDDANGTGNCSLPEGSSGRELTPVDAVTPLLTSQVRILSVDITTPDEAATDQTLAGLKKVAFWIGTYGDGSVLGMAPTPTVVSGVVTNWACEGGSLGDFCAVSKFETILYTANQD